MATPTGRARVGMAECYGTSSVVIRGTIPVDPDGDQRAGAAALRALKALSAGQSQIASAAAARTAADGRAKNTESEPCEAVIAWMKRSSKGPPRMMPSTT